MHLGSNCQASYISDTFPPLSPRKYKPTQIYLKEQLLSKTQFMIDYYSILVESNKQCRDYLQRHPPYQQNRVPKGKPPIPPFQEI